MIEKFNAKKIMQYNKIIFCDIYSTEKIRFYFESKSIEILFLIQHVKSNQIISLKFKINFCKVNKRLGLLKFGLLFNSFWG